MDNAISFTELKRKIGEHLRTALDVKEFSITFAKLVGLSSRKKVWRVNVSYKESPQALVETTSSFVIDAEDGRVLQFDKAKYWKF